MAYARYQDKRVIFGSKFVTGTKEEINYLTHWTNHGTNPYDTLSLSGRDIISAIKTTNDYAAVLSNEVYIEASNEFPVTIKFNGMLTVNNFSGINIAAQIFRNGSSIAISTVGYSGPNSSFHMETVFNSFGTYQISLINYEVGPNTFFAVNFNMINCEITLQ